ncbi:MAG: hypothetical protein ACYS8W_21260 [Planctomycetota bacterium]|jgi:hypothetical protein
MIRNCSKYTRIARALFSAFLLFLYLPAFAGEPRVDLPEQPPGPASPASDATKLDDSAFPGQLSANYARGDYDRLLEEWIELISKSPDAVETGILLHRIGRLNGLVKNWDKTEALWKDLLEKGMENGFNGRLVKRMHAGWLRKRGLEDEVEKLNLTDGNFQDWIVCGPFGKSDASTHDIIFPPERELDFSAEYPGATFDKKASWSKLPYKKPRSSINTFHYLRPIQGCTYALCQFSVDQEREVLVCVERPSNYRLFLDDNPALAVKSHPNKMLGERERSFFHPASGAFWPPGERDFFRHEA